MDLQFLLCWIGKHEPAEGRGRRVGRVDVASCKGCAREIMKTADGDWTVSRTK